MGKLTEEQVEFIKKLNQKNIYLGGSIALWYQGYDLGRKPKDIDMITCSLNNIKGITEEYEEAEDSMSCDEVLYSFTEHGVKYEILEAVNIETIVIDGIEMHKASAIIGAKFNYARKGVDKHIKDLKKLGFFVDRILILEKEIEKLNILKRRASLKNSSLIGSRAFDNYKYTIKCLQAGQVAPYKDTIYKYKVTTNEQSIDEILAYCRSKIDNFKNVENKGSNFSGSCSFQYGLEPYYHYDNEDKILSICYPYTG